MLLWHTLIIPTDCSKVFGEELPQDIVLSSSSSDGTHEPSSAPIMHVDTTSTYGLSTPELSPSTPKSARHLSPATSSASLAEIDELPEQSDHTVDDMDLGKAPSIVSSISYRSYRSEESLPSSSTSKFSPTTPSFQDRRRRAAKLTRFFGVGFPAISSSVTDDVPKVTLPAPAQSSRAVQVEINVAGRRLWGYTNDGGLQEAEMHEVIHQLRELRAG